MRLQPRGLGRRHWRLIVVALLISACATAPPPRIDGFFRAGSGPQFRSVSPPQVVTLALSLTGIPYRYGGASPALGFDCSGLVHYLSRRQGISLPRDARSMAAALPPVELGARRPGDLLFFNTRGRPYIHVGLYLGHEAFIHAPSRRSGAVQISDLRRRYWQARLTDVRRPPWP